MPKKIQPTKKALRQLGQKLVSDIDIGRNPALDVPIRTLSNVSYNPRTKLIMLGKKSAKRFFFNIAHVRKFTQTVDIAATANELLSVGKHLSLREVFYRIKRTIPGTSINIVDEQKESNQAIEDLELITGCSREQLHINANKMGSVAGNVIIKDKGDLVNWARLGSGGWSIPSNVEDIIFKRIGAKFVIYVEKAAEWERLHEDRVWQKLNCIIMCSQGQATRGVRRLLQRLHLEHKLPIYVLVDLDSWGIYIYSVLKYGSISLAHISESLAIPGARFLGLTVDDVERYGLRRHLIKFKEIDLKRLSELANYPWFKDKPEWQRQFRLMRELGGKIELAALSSKGISFISDTYIPDKIRNREWLD